MDTYTEKVNSIVADVKRDDKGKLVLPENLDAGLAYGARAEIRRRDTQSALAAANTKLAKVLAENDSLSQNWEQDSTAIVDSTELAELKHSDPDAWLAKREEVKAERQSQFKERKQQVVQAAHATAETATRAEIFAEFEEANPGLLTSKALNEDIPPRLVKNLEEGRVDYEGFLQSCVSYLKKGRALDKGTPAPSTPDLTGSTLPPGGEEGKLESDKYVNSDW